MADIDGNGAGGVAKAPLEYAGCWNVPLAAAANDVGGACGVTKTPDVTATAVGCVKAPLWITPDITTGWAGAASPGIL
jgi:hypothetical protein